MKKRLIVAGDGDGDGDGDDGHGDDDGTASLPPAIYCAFFWGGFGNQLHQYAFACTYAQKTHRQVVMPKPWLGMQMFAPPPVAFANATKRHKRRHSMVLRSTMPSLTRSVASQPTVLACEREDTRKCQMRADTLDWHSFIGRKSTTITEMHAKMYAFQFMNPCTCALHALNGSQTASDSESDSESELYVDVDSRRNDKVVIFDDLCAYRSEIFDGMDANVLRRDVFCFSDAIQNLAVYQTWFARRGTYVACLVRRGNCPVHISMRSYHDAITEHKPKFPTKCATSPVVWVSDEPSISTVSWPQPRDFKTTSLPPHIYTRSQARTSSPLFDAERGWLTVDGQYWKPSTQEGWAWRGYKDGLEDFLVLCFAGVLIRGNSSFGFWAGVINECQHVYSADVSDVPEHTYRAEQYKEGPKLVNVDVTFERTNRHHWMANSGGGGGGGGELSIANMQ
jgi:hypothetical protein